MTNAIRRKFSELVYAEGTQAARDYLSGACRETIEEWYQEAEHNGAEQAANDLNEYCEPD